MREIGTLVLRYGLEIFVALCLLATLVLRKRIQKVFLALTYELAFKYRFIPIWGRVKLVMWDSKKEEYIDLPLETDYIRIRELFTSTDVQKAFFESSIRREMYSFADLLIFQGGWFRLIAEDPSVDKAGLTLYVTIRFVALNDDLIRKIHKIETKDKSGIDFPPARAIAHDYTPEPEWETREIPIHVVKELEKDTRKS